MVKVYTHGQTEKHTTVNGNKELNTATVFGEAITVTVILVSGIKIKLMDMVSMSGRMATDMKENGSFVFDMVKAQTLFLMVTCI